MDTFSLIFIIALFTEVKANVENEEPILYYYGLEESERSLPACGARQACAALARRYWRAPALVRLCRCARRLRCDTRAPQARLVELNNRAHLQFCEPVSDWPECAINESPLSVETLYERMNPDELEELHHQGKHLYPPKIVLTCRCRNPNYWKLNEEGDTRLVYQCASLPVCKSGDYCGNVDSDLLALYQSCQCPHRHICVHSGGVPRLDISELLYRGKGWRAYCQPISDDYIYEDY